MGGRVCPASRFVHGCSERSTKGDDLINATYSVTEYSRVRRGNLWRCRGNSCSSTQLSTQLGVLDLFCPTTNQEALGIKLLRRTTMDPSFLCCVLSAGKLN